MRRRPAVSGVLVLVLTLAVSGFGVWGCSIKLTPAAGVADPVTVYVVDYGDSSRVLLPREEAPAYVEYGYGEWAWYAMNRESTLRVPAVLLWPTRGTLGRREWDREPTLEDLGGSPYVEQLIPFEVERGRAEAMVAGLDERFEASRWPGGVDTGEDALVANPRRGMEFVPDEDGYWIGRQSTTATAGWLKEMGVGVRGFALRSNFVVE